MATLAIYRLDIERFRRIRVLSWHPARGVNVILGGGDVGKTTILDAVALLPNPTNSTTLSDTDYYARNVEAVVRLEAHDAWNDQVFALDTRIERVR